jgi:phage terminase large subunit
MRHSTTSFDASQLAALPRAQRERALLLLREKARREAERAPTPGATKQPSDDACRDPAVFGREVFALTLWRRQEDVLDAVRDHDRVTVSSGHKIGKSTALAVLAWWFTADPVGRPGARVAMTSASARQVKKILWREVRALWRRARDRGYDLGPEPALDPETGVQWDDGRELFGFTARDPEKAAGTSGAWLLFLLDEASGIPEEIFEAIEGNRAGGAKVVLCSNPTQQSGEFYESHHTKRRFYYPIEISAEEAAAVDPHIPGLASEAWIAEKREEWGEESPLYLVRVKGRFAAQATDAVIGLALVLDAITRGRDADDVDDTGPLRVGLDVARFGDDETIAAPRRGQRLYPMVALPPGDGPDTAARLMVALEDAGLLRANELPRIIVDANGVGASVFDALARRSDCEAVAVNTGERASEPDDYINLRAELHFDFKRWLRDGGAIPDDARLQSELVAPTYSADGRNRLKVESKDDLRKRLRRSPDRADAAMLSLVSAQSRGDLARAALSLSEKARGLLRPRA